MLVFSKFECVFHSFFIHRVCQTGYSQSAGLNVRLYFRVSVCRSLGPVEFHARPIDSNYVDKRLVSDRCFYFLFIGIRKKVKKIIYWAKPNRRCTVDLSGLQLGNNIREAVCKCRTVLEIICCFTRRSRVKQWVIEGWSKEQSCTDRQLKASRMLFPVTHT